LTIDAFLPNNDNFLMWNPGHLELRIPDFSHDFK
jgi:hypothetical protein